MQDKKTVLIVLGIIAAAFLFTELNTDESRYTGYQAFGGGGNNSSNHTRCINGACVVVMGTGTNQCVTNADCRNPIPDRRLHTECKKTPNGAGYCVVVPGPGNNQCSTQNSFEDCNKLFCDPGVSVCKYKFGKGKDKDGCNFAGQSCNDSNGTAPDLVPSNLQHLYFVINFSTAVLDVNVTITNIGNGAAGASVTFFNGTFDPTYSYNHAFEPTPPLGPGTGVVISHRYIIPPPPNGTYLLTATADVNHQVSESNENNNFISKNFNIP